MKQHVNMMPEEYFVRDLTRRRVLRWVAFAVVVTAMIFALSYPMNARARRREAILGPLRENVASMEQWGERVALVTERLRVASGQQQAVDELLNEPFWNGFLSEVAAATGGELWITQLDTTSYLMDDGELETQVPLVTISGMAPSNFEVIRFLRRLSDSKHLQSVELQVSRAARTEEEDFKIEFTIQGIAR